MKLHGKKSQPVFEVSKHLDSLLPLLKSLMSNKNISQSELHALLRQYPKKGQGFFSKANLIQAYRELAGSHGLSPFDQKIVEQLKMKPIRTMSGVTPVTVLTKPFPCPGKCIFCPNDVRMPKSYLSNEPGAQRAEKNHFDPYLQTYNRLLQYHQIGHAHSKAEIIVLGGTWSFYSKEYKIWFIKRCFEALNDFGEGTDQRPAVEASIDVSHIRDVHKGVDLSTSGLTSTYNQSVSSLYSDQELAKKSKGRESASWDELVKEQVRNESADIKCVGLVLETRPDYISEEEVIMLRRLGCTKTQIGIQSLQDEVLKLNKRGHDVAATRRAFKLLRSAGMKIHAHWMPNLYGSSPEADIHEYVELFQDPDFKPDELKIYPCSLIDKTELMIEFKKGNWKPYSRRELEKVLSFTLSNTPNYCRLTRVIRDIPSEDIVEGNKLTNFRQIATKSAIDSGQKLWDIRAREIRKMVPNSKNLILNCSCYKTSNSIEYFLEFMMPPAEAHLPNHIAGFLRLSLLSSESFIKELNNAAIIREVHVYGSVVAPGKTKKGATQHLGLGKKLIQEAKNIAKNNGFKKLAVISAVGTREYYQKLGFQKGELYQVVSLD